MRRERSSTCVGRATTEHGWVAVLASTGPTQAFCALSRSRPPVAVVPYGDRERVPGCLRASRCRSPAATQLGAPGSVGEARRGLLAGQSAGTVVRYVARLRNQRRGRERLASSLWDVTLNNGTRTTRIRELRRGRARSVSFFRRVPRATRSRFCVDVATVTGTRAAVARMCVAVRAARPSPVTG
jgi:hypothetical protein